VSEWEKERVGLERDLLRGQSEVRKLGMYSVVEAWARQKTEEELVDRSASTWDSEPRRPSTSPWPRSREPQAATNRIDV